MAVQDTYPSTIRPAVVGAMANMRLADLLSRTVADTNGIGFGKVVQQGATAELCTAVLTDMDAASFLGITVLDRSTRPETPDLFAKGESARIMRRGAVWVQAGSAVAAGDAVTVTLATGVLGNAAVGAGVVAIPGARWDTSTTAAGLARLVIV